MTDRPNIILIVTDQQRYDTIAALGYPYMETPNLDRLAREGARFSSCYVAGASCVPARASLFTGYYPHTTGILSNRATWRHTWVERLRAAGYLCVNFGKMHTQPMDAEAGFDLRYIVENKDRTGAVRGADFLDEWDRAIASHSLRKPSVTSYRELNDFSERLGAFDWPISDHLHADTFVGDFAKWWISSAPVKKPLFLQVGFPGPHPPYDPPAAESQKYMVKNLPIDPVDNSVIENQPAPFRDLIQTHIDDDNDAIAHDPWAGAAARHRQRAHYLANVSLIDRKVGEILEALGEQGHLDNAIVVFTSDHGDCLGDHGHSQKWTMYEQVVRVPLLIWSPNRVSAGIEINGLVQQMDLAATLFEMADVPPPAGWEAVSFRQALDGGEFGGRPAVYCEQGRDSVFKAADLMSMVRTDRWKLVHFVGFEGGQLFDLRNDPKELNDLWNDPAAETVRRKLLQNLFDWRKGSQLHTGDWAESCR